MRTHIDKEGLVEIITENRSKHQAIFEEAVEGFRRLSELRLAEEIQRIKNGSLERVYISLPAPVNHMADYDRALKMLELAQEDSIMLDEQDAAQYVMDDWGWKNQFLTENASYSGLAATALNR